LLYGLQIASLNLPKPQPKSHAGTRSSRSRTETQAEQTVEEITIDPTLGILAPRADISETARPKSAVALLIEKMMQMPSEEEPEPAKPSHNQTATIPTLQATADSTISSLESAEGGTFLKGRGFSRRGNLAIGHRISSLSFCPAQPKQKSHFDRRRRTCR